MRTDSATRASHVVAAPPGVPRSRDASRVNAASSRMNSAVPQMLYSVPRTPLGGMPHAASNVPCRVLARLSTENSRSTKLSTPMPPAASGGLLNSVSNAAAAWPFSRNRCIRLAASRLFSSGFAAMEAMTSSNGTTAVNAWLAMMIIRFFPSIAVKRCSTRNGSSPPALSHTGRQRSLT